MIEGEINFQNTTEHVPVVRNELPKGLCSPPSRQASAHNGYFLLSVHNIFLNDTRKADHNSASLAALCCIVSSLVFPFGI